MSVPALRLVDANGEIHEGGCPDCSRKDDIIVGLERDIRGWATRFRELQREKDQEARDHPLWPAGELLFDHWRRVCNHPRSVWTPDRFWECLPFLSSPKYGPVMCERGIAGAAYDPFKTTRRNGSVKRHDGWEQIFAKAGRLEEFCCRAPRDWKPTLEMPA